MDKNKQLCTAAWDGNVEAVKKFVNLGAMVNEPNGRETALHFACFRGHLSVVNYLITQASADVDLQNNEGNTPLHYAIMGTHENYLAIVKYLIEQGGAEVNLQNNEGNTPLHYAALCRDLELVAYLVASAGANTSIQNNCGFTVINRIFR